MMVHPLAAIVAIQDSVAYVAKTSGPPASEAYMWAGYAITLGTLAAYIGLMVRRVGRSRHS